MKLLGWMHRKFRQNSCEPLKDFTIGHSCTCLTGQPSPDDQQYYPKPNSGLNNRTIRQLSQKDNYFRKSFAGLDSAIRVEGQEEEYEEPDDFGMEESSAFFHGFLAIGTLGSDPLLADPSTPTFGFSFDNITEKETEVTENELKLINDELEKVLAAEANDSSARNSHVSSITLSGKKSVDEAVCPLKGYLFGSSIELQETTVAVAKKEHRTSLGELFQRSKIAEETSCGSKSERGEKRTEKEGDKSKVHLMKKMLKKTMPHAASASASSKGSGVGTTVDSASPETKLHKILHMFHKKVHPESSRAAQKSHKSEMKNNICQDGEEGIIRNPQKPLSKEKARRSKSHSNPTQFSVGRSDSNGNREHWIKTDADYLVLEL